MSRIITFYSYRGGVGRTFAVANIAVLLAKRGKRVLLMDWDLEAPGLHRYFKPYLQSTTPGSEGLIHLLAKAEADSAIGWKSYTRKVVIPEAEPIDLITSGDQASDYVERVRSFSWNIFFEKHAGGDLLNQWKDEWKANYDFVMVDSRTGITDTGGVCTIYLPDILVLVFSADEQSFERGVQVATGVQKARRDPAVPRPPLLVLPLPGRFNARDEVDEAHLWLSRFAENLKPFYDDWLPKGINPRQILELTKVPYIPKYNFGDPLPVITQGTTDPEFPGFYLENAARLLVSDFRNAQQIILPESLECANAVMELRSALAAMPMDEAAIGRLLVHIETEMGVSSRLAELLAEAGVSFLRQQRFEVAESYLRRALVMGTDVLGSRHPLVHSALNHLAELLTTTGNLNEAERIYRQIVDLAADVNAPEVAATYKQLGNVCRQMGRPEEAVDWYSRALRVVEMSEPPGDFAILATYSNLAGLYRELGRTEAAVESYRRALHVAERNGQSEDPAVLAIYHNLAGLYRGVGQSEEAIHWYQRALKLAEATGRPGDHALLAIYNNLAGLYREMGRSAEAVDWSQRALKLAEKTGRPGDPAVLATYNHLAGLYREMGRSAEAINWYQRAVKMVEMSERPGDLGILATYSHLAGLYRELGRSAEAIDWYQRAVKLAEGAGRSVDPAVPAIYHDLAGVYREVGRTADAIDWHQRAVDSAESTYGSESPQVAPPLNHLAETMINDQRTEEAEALLRRALAILGSTLGEDTPIATRIRSNLAQLLASTGRDAEAAEVSNKARFDVFISYSRVDSHFVRTLADKLSDKGLRVYFDQWHLRPGDSIGQALDGAVALTASFLVCIGESGPCQSMERELTEILNGREQRNQQIIPVLLPDASAEKLPSLLGDHQCLDLSRGLTDEGIVRLMGSLKRRRQKV